MSRYPRAPYSASISDHALLGLLSRVDGDCLVWIGSIDNDGYGRARKAGRLAHRVAYETWVGPIPQELTLDHLCRNRRCIWPSHLEAVTKGVNTLRGEGPSARAARRDHCLYGHPLSGDNLRMAVGPRGNSYRRCVICLRATIRLASARYRARRRIVEGKSRR